METNNHSAWYCLHATLIRWILFIAFVLTMPVFWFVLVAVGFIPLIIIILNLLQGLWLLDLFVIVANGIHLALWGVLFYYVAGLFARAIEKAPSLLRLPIVVAILLALICLTFLPIYGFGNCGGGHAEGNLYQFINSPFFDWLIRPLRFYLSCFGSVPSVAPW